VFHVSCLVEHLGLVSKKYSSKFFKRKNYLIYEVDTTKKRDSEKLDK